MKLIDLLEALKNSSEETVSPYIADVEDYEWVKKQFINDYTDIIRVSTSRIPNAGKGIFAKRDIKQGEKIGELKSIVVTEELADKIIEDGSSDKYYVHNYFKNIRGHQWLFAINNFRYMNSVLKKQKGENNVEWGDKDIKSKLGGKMVMSYPIVSTRPIKKDEEILVFYEDYDL
jgi:hypothetical protein